METFDLKTFLNDQCDEIRKYRLKRVEESGVEVNNEYVLEWIRKYAKEYREEAELSGKYYKNTCQ